MKRRKFRIPSGDQLPLVLVAIAVAVIVALLYTYHLGRFIPAGGGENQTLSTVSGISHILDNPLGIAYKLPAWLLLKLPGSNLVAIRLASVLITLVTGGVFFLLAKRWYGALSGLAVTLLFVSSSWMLQTGRYGGAYSLLTGLVLGLLAMTIYVNSEERAGRALAVATAASVAALYTPGGIWFLAAGLSICWRSIRDHAVAASRQTRIIVAICGGLAITGLLAAFIRQPSLTLQWAGLPDAFPSWVQLGKQAVLSGSGLLIRGPVNPDIWLAHTPLLDVASSVLFVLGVVFYSRHITNPRTRLLALFFACGILLTALNGAPGLSYLVPLAYLVIGGGFAYFVHQWRKVFPRNPIAESVALSLVGFLLVCIVNFHQQRYFVAWHSSPQTVRAHKHTPASSQVGLPYLIQ